MLNGLSNSLLFHQPPNLLSLSPFPPPHLRRKNITSVFLQNYNNLWSDGQQQRRCY